MPHNEPMNPIPNEAELEAALSDLRPMRPALGRDSLMFRAGQAAGRRQARWWQAAATTLGVMLVVAMGLRPTPPAPRTIYVEKNVSTVMPSIPSRPEHDEQNASRTGRPAYLAMRDDVLLRGVEVISAGPSAAMRSEPLPRLERPIHMAVPPVRIGIIEKLEHLLDAGV